MEIGDGLKWIVGTVIGILATLGSVLGVSKLVELRQTRRYSLADKNNEVHQTNQAADIDLDKTAFQAISERLQRLEDKFETLQDKHNSLMVQNATTEAENKHLTETVQRQEKEIDELQRDRRLLQDRVNSLTNLVGQLKTEIDTLKLAKSADT